MRLLSCCLLASLALGGNGDDKRIEALVERFCNGTTVERRAAQVALMEYGREVWPWFKRLVNDHDPDVRRRARLVWLGIAGGSRKGWAIPKQDTPYDPRSGLPMRVYDRKSGVEMALLLPGREVRHGRLYELDHALYVGVHEVTLAEWGRGRRDLFYFHKRERARFPITDVDPKDVRKFLKHTGLRLPSAAEWEYACYANGVQRQPRGPIRAASTRYRNGFGLCDMIGNVAELCADGKTRGGSAMDVALLGVGKGIDATKGEHVGFRVVREP